MTRVAKPPPRSYDGLGRQKCAHAGCDGRSLRGHIMNHGMCRYHWACWLNGVDYARKAYPDHPEAKRRAK
jgi:hypothetical protein